MNFSFTAEQQEYGVQLRKLFEAKSPLSQIRKDAGTPCGFDSGLWHLLADQLGVQGINIPESYGGSGQSYLELGVVMYESGRALSSMPLLASVALATTALVCSGDRDAMGEWLPQLASGAIVATLATSGPHGTGDPGAPGVTASFSEGGYLLDGVTSFVIHGAVADLLLVSAVAKRGLSLFAVQADAPGMVRAALSVLDPTRPQARVTFEQTPARLVGVEGDAGLGLERTLQLAAVLLAQEQVGAAQACLDMAVGYARVRTQFGRPIGSFQAIQHICADVFVELESARAAADYATWAAVSAPAELPVMSSLAKAFCSDTAFLAASQNIQVHGGIGFTWEHDAHLFFKRATSMSQYLGSPANHRELLARQVLSTLALEENDE